MGGNVRIYTAGVTNAIDGVMAARDVQQRTRSKGLGMISDVVSSLALLHQNPKHL
jgi:hypothetical protein